MGAVGSGQTSESEEQSMGNFVVHIWAWGGDLWKERKVIHRARLGQ